MYKLILHTDHDTPRITEATYITPKHSGYPNEPIIYNNAQIAAWKTVMDAVYKMGSFIFL
jgi:NADPH2 dehydrogenase